MSAKDTVRRNKTAIVATLSGDRKLILNKVHENSLINDREYKNLKSIEKVEDLVVELVDTLMNKGEESCGNFLKLLETDEEINDTYRELKSMQLNDSDGPPPGSKRPKEAGVRSSTTMSRADKAKIVDEKRATLIQDVTAVMAITEDLGDMVHPEVYSQIIKDTLTSRAKMRVLYDNTLRSGGEAVKAAFYDALKKHHPYLV